MRAWLELRHLPRRVWILAAASLVNRAGMMALPFLSLYVVRAMRLPASRAGQLLALYGTTALVAAPMGGRLVDRWGTRRVMLITLTFAGLLALLFPFARTFQAMAALIVLWSAGSEAFRPASMAAVSESAPPAMHKQAYALHRLAVNVGMSVGPAVGGLLAARSFAAIWWIDGVTSLLSAALLARALDDAPRAAPLPGAAPSARGLSDPRLRAFLLSCVLVAMVFFQHEAALSLFLVRDLGFSEPFFGLLFTVNTALIIALEIPLNHATARWPHRRTLALGAALFGLGFGAYALVARAWHAVAATAIWTFGEMILMPGMSAYVAEISPADRRGEYMGLYMMAFSLAFAAGPWAGLAAYERWGGAALWGASLAIGLASSLAFWAAAADARVAGSEPVPAR